MLNQMFGYSMLVVLTFALLYSLVTLILALPQHTEVAERLLGSAAILWVTNVIVFAVWYWRLDAGGPNERDGRESHSRGAFLFPQMSIVAPGSDGKSIAEVERWRPQFVDYLALSFYTCTSFAPTDVPVLSRWAKLMMMTQAVMSLTTMALLAGTGGEHSFERAGAEHWYPVRHPNWSWSGCVSRATTFRAHTPRNRRCAPPSFSSHCSCSHPLRSERRAGLHRRRYSLPGLISSAANDASPAFTPDGRTVFFTRSNPSQAAILVSELRNGQWSTPQIAPFSGEWRDIEPAMSPDGKFLVFSSNRPARRPTERRSTRSTTASRSPGSAATSGAWIARRQGGVLRAGFPTS